MFYAKFLHIRGFTVWVGGMFFAHNALQPTVAVTLEPPLRLTLLAGVFTRFFRWVGIAIVLILGSGLTMMVQMSKPPLSVATDGRDRRGHNAIYGHIFFAPFRRLKRGVAAQKWQAAVAAMASIRKLDAVKLVLGLLTIAIGGLGPLAY